MNGPHCVAITGRRPGTYGFEFTFCHTTRGLRSYWRDRTHLGDQIVHYCGAPGHEANVRRRLPEHGQAARLAIVEVLVDWDLMDPEWPGDLPEYADDMTFAKWTRDRAESWTMAEDGSVTVGLDYTRTEA